MITLEIEYPVLFFTRRVKGQSPSCWSELTGKQFAEISRNVNGTEMGFQFLSVLTSFSERVLKLLSPFHLLQLSREINFFGNTAAYPSMFIIRRLRGTKLFSPNPKLDGMTFGQFIFADTYYTDWMAKKDTETLNKFIASLYLYRGEKFSEKTLAAKVSIIAKTRMSDRLSIAYNYSLIISWLQNSYPLIFHVRADDIRPDDIRPDISSKDSGWLKLFNSLVGDDLINRDRYAKLPIHTVLGYLTQKYKDTARCKG